MDSTDTVAVAVAVAIEPSLVAVRVDEGPHDHRVGVGDRLLPVIGLGRQTVGVCDDGEERRLRREQVAGFAQVYLASPLTDEFARSSSISRATIGPAFWFWPVTRLPSTTQWLARGSRKRVSLSNIAPLRRSSVSG